MPLAPPRTAGRVHRLYTPAGSAGQQLTAAGSGNSPGGYTQLASSVPSELAGIEVVITTSSGNGRDFLIDLAVGAASSEVIIAEHLIYSPGSDDVAYHYRLPLRVARGARLAARCRCSTANSTCKISAWGFALSGGSPISFHRCTTYGAATADSGGTELDPGSSADTKSAWVQLVASTTRRTRALAVAIGNIRNNNQVGLYEWGVDIAIGGSGSEQIIIPDLAFQCDTASDARLPNVFGPYPVDIPVGTRLSARTAIGNASADATDRKFDVIAYAFS